MEGDLPVQTTVLCTCDHGGGSERGQLCPSRIRREGVGMEVHIHEEGGHGREGAVCRPRRGDCRVGQQRQGEAEFRHRFKGF